MIYTPQGTSGNHTPSIKPILPERVTLPSGNELHDGAETGPVDKDGARRTKSKHSTSSFRACSNL